MINFDVEYFEPKTWTEAVKQYNEYQSQNKKVMYVAGNTEFISRARMNEIHPEALIDIKGIPECRVVEQQKSELVIGAAATLTEVAESNIYPLLSQIARRIATKTERNKITIGGNLASNLPYREGILPFLLANSEVLIATAKGLKRRKISHAFTDLINFKAGEFIVQINTEKHIAHSPYFTEKKTKQSSVNYPILTSAAIELDGKIRLAFSGLCDYPFRNNTIEEIVNDRTIHEERRIKKVMKYLPTPIVDDMHASKKYREFVLKRAITKIIKQLEDVS